MIFAHGATADAPLSDPGASAYTSLSSLVFADPGDPPHLLRVEDALDYDGPLNRAGTRLQTGVRSAAAWEADGGDSGSDAGDAEYDDRWQTTAMKSFRQVRPAVYARQKRIVVKDRTITGRLDAKQC